MTLLTYLTSLETDAASFAYGGLVDRDTACARDVALWDEEMTTSVERSATVAPPPSRPRSVGIVGRG